MDNVTENKVEKATVKLKFFCARTGKPEEFMDKLEELCREYSDGEDFFFNYAVEE